MSTQPSGPAAVASIVDFKHDIDKARKVYRCAVDVIRRLDETSKGKTAYKEIFTSDCSNLRHKLKDYCERLMFFNPLEYGHKAEEFLWRKVYYDVIQLMKHNKKQMRPTSSLDSAYRAHLMAATGYYHELLFKLQMEFDLRLEGILDFYHIQDPRSYKRPHQPERPEVDPAKKKWAIKSCHNTLIYLGDIARYQNDYDGLYGKVIAQRYYSQAILLCPEYGMPYNQLGTLAGTRLHNLDAVYHYLRCLSSTNSFDGAQGNLIRLFERNASKYYDLNIHSERGLPPEQQRLKDIRKFIVRFMYLLENFHSERKISEPAKLQETCQTILQDFNLCMFYQPPHVLQPVNTPNDHSDRLTCMDQEVVFKVLVLCLITIYRLQKKGDNQVMAAIAFSLALFSHILNHVVIRLQSALNELENPRRVLTVEEDDLEVAVARLEESDSEEEKSVEDDYSTEEEKHGSIISPNSQEKDEALKVQKRRLQKLRVRRRRRNDSEGTTTSMSSGFAADDSDLSEGELSYFGATSSEDEDEADFFNKSDSSDSDSDHLMVSQQLQPGFSAPDGDDPLAESMNSSHWAQHVKSGLASLSSSFNAGILEKSFNAASNNPLQDVNDFLKDMPTELLSDSSSFLSDTLKLAHLFGSKDDEFENRELNSVIDSQKEVSIPPGFGNDPEAKYVEEINEKLAHYQIETDTDNSSLPTESEIETDATDLDSPESVVDKEEYEHKRLEHLLHVIGQEGLLHSIKVYCDWLQCHPHIITTCAQSSQSLWTRLSVLLNFLPTEADLLNKCKSLKVCREVLDQIRAATHNKMWTPVLPLREDIHLQGFPTLRKSHQYLQYNAVSKKDFTTMEESVLRICSLRRFGYLMGNLTGVQFSYDKETATFFGPVQQHEPVNEDKNMQKKQADAQARRHQLMRDMAQLRLQAEVSQLEGSLHAADSPSLPPYLVPDALVLCENLAQLKQLVLSAGFILIIPVTVIDHLDVLKRETVGARNAIRWLEAEFKKGNRYVRAQKVHEKIETVTIKNLRRKDKDAWRFQQIFDCCKYLLAQSSECEASQGMVCILTSTVPDDPDDDVTPLRIKNIMAIAKKQGVLIQTAGEFHKKWKEISATKHS